MIGADHDTAIPRPLRRDRARVACWRCHKKKIRCNSSNTGPCFGCARTSIECVPIDSQRGRYARKSRKSDTRRRSLSMVQANQDGATDIAVDATTTDHSATDGALHGASEPHHNILQTTRASAPRAQTDLPPGGPTWPPQPGLSSMDCSPGLSESPEMLYAQIAERSVTANDALIRPADQSVFLGEAFSLTYVVHDVLAPHLTSSMHYKKRLHFPIFDGALSKSRAIYSDDNTVNNQMELLKAQGLFYKPPDEALERLLVAYLEHFHPAFPVIERTDFSSARQAQRQSHLVLNAVLMIAVTLCDSETLKILGCDDRHVARTTFFKQARALYDADAEPHKINNICGVFLMSFWWGGPNDQKDSWHWLGIAIGLAQSLGLHRTTKNSNIDSRTASRWKLNWWSLRIRDILVSGSIGRPQHVCDNDCDVELPEPADVADELPGRVPGSLDYFSQVAKLCAIMSRIITSRYATPGAEKPRDNCVSLEQTLSQFYKDIPPSLRYDGVSPEFGQQLWPSMLTMAYNYAVLLLCRPSRSARGEGQVEEWGNESKAISAANVITRTMEDMLAVSMVRLCQVHTIPALFNALAVHVHAMCNSNAIGRELAETRARICMLGLTALQKSWPVSGWVLKLFVNIMKKLKRSPRGGSAPNRSRSLSETREVDELRHEPALSLPASIPSPSTTHGHPSWQNENPHPSNREPSTAHPGNEASSAPSEWSALPWSVNFEDYDELIPNMFAFDDTFAGSISDQDNFFRSLDFAHSREPGTPHLWSYLS